MTTEFYLASRKNTQRRDKYITFWRADNSGYAWPLPWAGRYSEETVSADPAYYDNANTWPIPCEEAEKLGLPPLPGTVDGNVGPIVPNTPVHWQALKRARARLRAPDEVSGPAALAKASPSSQEPRE